MEKGTAPAKPKGISRMEDGIRAPVVPEWGKPLEPFPFYEPNYKSPCTVTQFIDRLPSTKFPRPQVRQMLQDFDADMVTQACPACSLGGSRVGGAMVGIDGAICSPKSLHTPQSLSTF